MPDNVPADPLFYTQWGLSNTGQQGGHVGTDINVLPVLGQGYGKVDGKGVRVAVVDTGVQLDHPDLVANIDAADSYDAVSSTTGNGAGSPILDNDNHGTAVAGIIAAAENGVGGVGVAPEATLVSDRIPLGKAPITIGEGSENDQGATTQLDVIARGMVNAIAQNVDVANNSWGSDGAFSNNFNHSGQASVFEAPLTDAATDGRGGKGIIEVFANGNARAEGANGELNGVRNSRFVVAVAALDNSGVVSAYSTPGANLLVSAPAGASTAQQAGVPGNGITTTDRTGAAGYNNQASPSGDYTFAFNGTSAATPFVSGVVALMLQANPNLGYRDVQSILAGTARLTDPSGTQWATNNATTSNGGGMHFSANYGFGLVDAHGAVRLAQSEALLGLAPQDEADVAEVTGTSAPNANLADGQLDKKGFLFTSTTISLGSGTVEHLDLTLGMQNTYAGDVSISLKSPSGTTVNLLPFNTNAQYWPSVATLGTDAFWGEQAAGQWTVYISIAPNQVTHADGSVFKSASLTAYGAASPTGSNDLVYTDDFATMAGQAAGRQVITAGASGTDTLNLSPTSGTNILDLTNGVGSIGGQAVTVAAGSRFANVFGGDGSNVLFAGSNDQRLVTGFGQSVLNLEAGNDTVLSRGQDTIFAGSGNSAVFGQGASMFAVGGTGLVTVNGLSGSDTLFGGTGGSIMFGGTGGNNVLVGGSGNATLTGGGENDVLFATGAAQTVLIAAGGSETLSGGASSAGNVFFAGSGADVIGGGSGADMIFLGSGSATVDGGGGGNLFVCRNGLTGGTVLINGFDAAGGDRVALQNYAAGELAADLATARVSAGASAGTTLTLSDHTVISFAGVTNLSAAAFV